MPETVQKQEEPENDTEETEMENENYDPGEVKINKVTFKGFKSFQQKTAIPLFEGLTAVVGENGNGKCVTGDTEILLASGEKKKIREMVENSVEKSCEEIDDGYVSYEGDHKVKSLNPKTLKTEERNVLAYAKREAPENLLRIKTRSGREITATEDHPLFIFENGEVRASDAENLEEGRRIAAPRKIDIDESSTEFNELLDIIDEDDRVYIPQNDEIKQKIRKIKEDESKTWKELAEAVEVPVSFFHGIRDGQAGNFAHTVKTLRYSGVEDKDIRNLIPEIKSKNHSKTCNIPWNNSREFGRLLGYLMAEGQNPKSSNQIRFTNSKENIIENYQSLIHSVFDIETSKKEYRDGCWDVLSYSSPAKIILDKFGISREGSSDKEIPDLFFRNSNKEELSALLEGLYAGDGYVSWNAIELSTKSKRLARDTQEALLRLGINSRIQKKSKTATNTDSTGLYFQINVTGAKNVEKFHQKISIPHQMKKERIEELTKRESNTNIDLIEANGLVQQAVKKLDISPYSRSNKKKIPKLGAYYGEKCLTTRQGLNEIIDQFDDNIEELEKIERIANSDIYWDEIVSVEEIEIEEDWVYDLNIAVNHNFIGNNTFVHNSNLLDGISFVFGRRSSNLRAEKLTQLIFNGGEDGKPSDYAKVTVHLDNTSGIFDEFLEEGEEAEEITVGRKITQAGSASYKFQGHNCKRSKIDTIAEKANIDPEGYHFVRQGKVTEIVEQSNVERRKVIDELSGVAKFDERKEGAEEELEEVEEKLQEQEILLDEKKQYLKKLKEEKELAKKHRELDERKEKLEASRLEVRKRALSNQLANINTDTSEKKEEIQELEEELDEIDQEIDEKQNRIKEIEEQQTSGNDVQHLENRIEKKKGEIQNKRDKVEDLEETIKELEQMQNRRNTGSRAVDAVLSLNKDGVYGAFQDLISAENRFGVAVETAAGGHMNDLVVKDKKVAMECINYLKRENIGRARTLPMDKIKDRSKSAKSQMAKKKKGVIGYATEVVNYDGKYEKAVNHVFSDTLIAEDLDSVKNIDGVRVVTLDGDVMSRGGSMTGGKKKSRKKKSKKLSQNLDPEKKRKKKKEVEKEIESLQKDVAELKDMKKRKEDEQGSDQELRNEKNSIRDDLQEMREKRQEVYSRQQKLKTKIDDVGSKKANLKAELENVKTDLEEYDFNEEELKLDASPEALKKKKKKVLRKQNSMGPVNMMAIDEYKEKKEEFEEFKDQVSEIRQEKLEIEDMIEEIDEKKRECFMETLEQIQESFGRIFTNLFDGGEAKLVLEDDDIEKGLKIRVKPPGKEPHIIQALSGGEKTMTAIAFVFAILEYEESPFYIMDEIDAALDKQNSKKLSELLKEYADENQFIVISHNEITVRHAERAYGVTMQDGVTKMRSIELEV